MQSKQFELNKLDYIAIGKGLLITLAGAALTYFSQVITNTNFGVIWTPLVMTGWALLVNVARKWLEGK